MEISLLKKKLFKHSIARLKSALKELNLRLKSSKETLTLRPTPTK